MYVMDRTIKDIPSIKPNESLSKAYKILNEGNLNVLPVIDKENHIIGMLTKEQIKEVSPNSKNLSKYEINFLLSKIKVQEIMLIGIYKIHKNRQIEEAARIIKEQHLNYLPVVDDEDKFVGIITKDNIFNYFIKLFGISSEGTTITISKALKSEEKNNSLNDILLNIINIASKSKINLINLTTNTKSYPNEIILKTDSENTDELEKNLKELEFNIISKIKQ